MIRGIQFLSILASLLLLVGSCLAEDIPASEVVVNTPMYSPSFATFEPPLGLYEYTVGWEGIPAAVLTVSVSQEGYNYRIIASAKTKSAIDLFYKMRYRAESLVSAVDLEPIRTVIDEQENSRTKNTQISFKENGEINSVRSKNGKPAEVITFNSPNLTLEPFSAAFYARSMDWKVGQKREFDVFNGKSRYLITLSCTEIDEVSVAGKDREAWVIVPEVKNLTSPDADKKLRSARLYVSTDEKKELLKIVSSVFIGSVVTKMTSFTPYDRVATPALAGLRTKAGTLVQ